ncbi:MAG: type III-B CRISPR-associated protein Cas10/Cmr2 [Acidobacteriota bacterium]
MNHVLAISLGPVQEFLAAARRTRDLWFGSWLLSELARAAAKAIEARHPGSVIFPAADALADGDATFANKILARVPDDPESAAGAAIEALQKRRDELREMAFKALGDLKETEFHRAAAGAQVSDLIEIQWASALEFGGEAGYADARRTAEGVLAARKNQRDWIQPHWGAPVPKSAIDGLRESVIDEKLFEGNTGWDAERLYKTFGVEGGERLDGVSLLKRLGRQRGRPLDHHFASTGHIAAWPLLERLRKPGEDEGARAKVKVAWDRLKSAIVDSGVDLRDHEVYAASDPAGNREEHPILGRLDGSLLFEGRLADLFRDRTEVDAQGKRRPISAADRRRLAAKLRGALADFLKAAELPAPLPYYAILHADGDRMGSAIDHLKELPRHRELSQQLTAFAVEARRIVEATHHGELVYAGGDDVLAFLPLHEAIPCARALADTFAGLLEDFPDEDDVKPTLSVGLGIAHFMAPLSRTLELARSAEKDAKAVPGKNALALRIDKRSGPTLRLAGSWTTIDLDLENFAKLHARDEISDKGGFDLRELARLIEGSTGDDRKNLEDLAQKEAIRILARKQPKHGQDAGHSEAVRKRLREILERSKSIAAFADRLIAARLFGEALVQSGRPIPPLEPEVVA